ncbi:MAG: BTAD domain-containing putative transcriptional regulator [Actinomycetota bacterium]
MARVAISVLGPVSAEVDGRQVDLGGPRQRALLAALTLDVGVAVSRDLLVDRLWSDDPPSSAPKLVQKYVSGLRATLGAGAIETVGDGYRLAIAPTDVDVVRFEAAIAADRHHGTIEFDDVWSGPVYAGCGDPEFVVVERARLTRLRLDAQLGRLGVRVDNGEHRPATAALERLATDHPEHEGVAALLMRALYASDRHVDALRVARRTRRYLSNEIGVDPSPDFVDLEQRILRHDESLRRPAAPTPSSTEPPDIGQPSDRVVEDRHEPATLEEVRAVVIVFVSEPPPLATPDDALAHHRDLRAELQLVADEYGVAIERSVGHEAVILFGVPARDDDPDRAATFAADVERRRPRAAVAVVAGDAVVAVEPHLQLLTSSLVDAARAIVAGTDAPEPARGGAVGAAELATEAATAAPFEGRRDEAEAIHQVWHRVIDDDRLRVIEVVGDAGIGKTRLVNEVVRSLRPAPTTAAELGFAPLGDRGALATIRRAVRALAADGAALDDWLATTGDVHGPLATRLRAIVDPTNLHELDAPDEWASPVEQMYRLTAERGPMVVVVEDLHWADSTSLERIAELIADLVDHPVLIIATRRPAPQVDLVRDGPVRERSTLHLGPLDAEAVEQIAGVLGSELGTDALRIAVEGSGGSPLFLLHFVQMLTDRPDATDIGVPDNVRRVVAMRLDQLPTPLRSTIQAASLVPEQITVGTIAAISQRSEDETAAALTVLARSGLLQRSPATAAPDRFHHALVADVAYAQLTRATRIELHRRAARWFDGANEDVDHVESAAWHWEQVVALTEQSRVDVSASDRDAAQRALAASAQSAWHVDATRAAELLTEAARLAPPDSGRRADALLKLGEITTYAGDFRRSVTALTEAGEIFERVGDLGALGEALARRARAQWFLGRADDIDDLLDAAARHLHAAPPSASHAAAATIAAAQTSLRGRAADALELADRAATIVRDHGSDQDAIRLRHVRGFARVDLGDSDGLDDLRAALQSSLDGGYGNLACQSYNNLAELVWPLRGPGEAIELARAGLDLAVESGFLGQAAWHVAQLCELSFDLGDWDAVIALPEAHPARTPVVEWTLVALSARVRFWRGDDDAASVLEEALERSRATEEAQVLVPMLAGMAAAAAAMGDDRRVAEIAGELGQLVRDAPHEVLRAAAEATRALCTSGHVDVARTLLSRDAPSALRRRLMWESSLGHIAEADGRSADAIEHFRRAEHGWSSFPHPFEAAHAAAGLARNSAATGRSTDATEARDRARARFDDLGATRCITSMAFAHGLA